MPQTSQLYKRTGFTKESKSLRKRHTGVPFCGLKSFKKLNRALRPFLYKYSWLVEKEPEGVQTQPSYV